MNLYLDIQNLIYMGTTEMSLLKEKKRKNNVNIF